MNKGNASVQFMQEYFNDLLDAEAEADETARWLDSIFEDQPSEIILPDEDLSVHSFEDVDSEWDLMDYWEDWVDAEERRARAEFYESLWKQCGY